MIRNCKQLLSSFIWMCFLHLDQAPVKTSIQDLHVQAAHMFSRFIPAYDTSMAGTQESKDVMNPKAKHSKVEPNKVLTYLPGYTELAQGTKRGSSTCKRFNCWMCKKCWATTNAAARTLPS